MDCIDLDQTGTKERLHILFPWKSLVTIWGSQPGLCSKSYFSYKWSIPSDFRTKMSMERKLSRVSNSQQHKTSESTMSRSMHYAVAFLILVVQCFPCSGICHMSACDALQEMKNDIAKHSSANEAANQDESLEIRFAKLERRVRSVEQPGMLQNCSYLLFVC